MINVNDFLIREEIKAFGSNRASGDWSPWERRIAERAYAEGRRAGLEEAKEFIAYCANPFRCDCGNPEGDYPADSGTCFHCRARKLVEP